MMREEAGGEVDTAGGQQTEERRSAPVRKSRPTSPTREQRVLLGMVALVAVAWTIALVFMVGVPLSGDEKVYAGNARLIADLLTGRGDAPAAAVAREVVDNGWFMPGMSFALLPLYVVNADPGLAVLRTYAAVVIFVLWLWALREYGATFGREAAAIFLVFPSLAVMWLLFANTLWADLPAGLLLAITLARVYRVAAALLEDHAVRVRDVVVVEVIMAAMVYLRGNTIVAVVGIHVFLAGLAVISRQWDALLRRVGIIGVGFAVFAVLLAPWSLAASRALGGTVVTTSSAALAIGITFGDVDELCFGPCAEGRKLFGPAAKFSRQRAREQGVSPLEVQREMSAHALRDVTLASYTKQVRRNFRSFLGHPGGFAARFTNDNLRDFSRGVAPHIRGWIRGFTHVLYVPFLIVLVLANLVVLVRRRRLQILSLAIKLLTVSLFVQPFVHPSHARYWVTFAPLTTISVVLFLNWLRARRAVSAGAGAAGDVVGPDIDDAGDRFLTALQALYVAVIVVVALVILLA